VNSQAFPAVFAASAVGPAAAASACARVAKVSMRQNKGPGGNCATFFSAIDVTSNFCAEAIGDDSHTPATAAHTKSVILGLKGWRVICASPHYKSAMWP
jgi:hypothetical protein